MKLIYLLFIPILFFTACTPKYEKLKDITKAKVLKVNFDDIEGFYEDDLNKAYEAFKKACIRSKRYDLFKKSCKEVSNSSNALEFFTSNFQAYKLIDKKNSDKGIITGYYEPLLYGSRIKTKKYKYPVYKTPKDLIIVDLSSVYPTLKKYRLRGKLKGNKLVPYDARKEFNTRKNKASLEVIAYVDNKVDLFLLQIQGSGKILLDNKTLINVGYSNQNGRKYRSIGKYMLKKGYIGKGTASIQGMRKFFENNPEKIEDILNHNESYVFFHESKKGATGSLGVELIAKRNLAVDRSYIPLGMPVFIQTKNPVTKENINKLMLAADTGGAIKGEIRADFFWGYGENAFKYAGKMKEKGTLYIFVPKK